MSRRGIVGVAAASLVVSFAVLAVVAGAVSVDELLRLGKPVVLHLRLGGPVVAGVVDEERGGVLLVYYSRENGVGVAYYAGYEAIDRVGAEYPLQGMPVTVGFDRYPSPERVVLGTDMGELLVISLAKRAASYQYVQAGPKPVYKARLIGDMVVARLGDDSLRLYRLGEGGWHTIAPVAGTGVLGGRDGDAVLDFEALVEPRGDRLEPRPLLAVVEEPKVYPSKLRVQVVRPANETLEPVPGATVFAYIENLDVYTPQVTTGDDGIASVPLMVPAHNVTLFVVAEGVCYAYRFTDTGYTEPYRVYTLTTPLLLTPSRIAVCPEPERLVYLVFYRADAEEGFTELAKTRLSVAGNVKVLALLKPPTRAYEYLLVLEATPLGEEYEGYGVRQLQLIYLDENLNILNTTWVPLSSEARTVTYTRDAEYIAVGLSDGLTLVLRREPGTGVYRLWWSYRMPSSVEGLVFAEALGEKTDVVPLALLGGDGSLQLIALNRTLQAPVARIENVTAFVTGYGAPHGLAVSRDSNTIAVSAEDGAYIILGLGDRAASTPLVDPVNLYDYVLQSVEIRVVEPDGTPVPNATVVIANPAGETVYKLTTGHDGVVKAPYILPGTYIVNVTPVQPWLEGISTEIRIVNASVTVNVTLPYRPVPVMIIVSDNYTGGPPVQPINVTVVQGNRTVDTVFIKPGEQTAYLRLVKGFYEVFVEPFVRPGEPRVYLDWAGLLVVPNQTVLEVRLERITSKISIGILDAETGKEIVEPMRLTVKCVDDGRVLYDETVDAEKLPITITTGCLRIEVSAEPAPPPGEEPRYKPIEARVVKLTPGATVREVLRAEINPIPLTIIVRDGATGEPPLVPIEVRVDGTLASMLPAGVDRTVVLAAKGTHIVELVPQPAFGKDKIPLYRSVKREVEVRKPLTLEVALERSYALLKIWMKDPYIGNVSADQLEILLNGTRIAVVPAGKPLYVEKYVLKGFYMLKINSLNNVYNPHTEDINVTEDTVTLNIVLKRKVVPVTVVVVDDMGNGLTGALVRVTGQTLVFSVEASTTNGEAPLSLPYGTYQVCAQMPGYYTKCTTLDPAATQQVVLRLQPYPQTILLRNLPLIIVVVAVVAALGMVYRYREKIMKAIAPEEEYI